MRPYDPVVQRTSPRLTAVTAHAVPAMVIETSAIVGTLGIPSTLMVSAVPPADDPRLGLTDMTCGVLWREYMSGAVVAALASGRRHEDATISRIANLGHVALAAPAM